MGKRRMAHFAEGRQGAEDSFQTNCRAALGARSTLMLTDMFVSLLKMQTAPGTHHSWQWLPQGRFSAVGRPTRAPSGDASIFIYPRKVEGEGWGRGV